MKHLFYTLSLITAIVLTSCSSNKITTFEKRKYNKGYHIDFASREKSNNSIGRGPNKTGDVLSDDIKSSAKQPIVNLQTEQNDNHEEKVLISDNTNKISSTTEIPSTEKSKNLHKSNSISKKNKVDVKKAISKTANIFTPHKNTSDIKKVSVAETVIGIICFVLGTIGVVMAPLLLLANIPIFVFVIVMIVAAIMFVIGLIF